MQKLVPDHCGYISLLVICLWALWKRTHFRTFRCYKCHWTGLRGSSNTYPVLVFTLTWEVWSILCLAVFGFRISGRSDVLCYSCDCETRRGARTVHGARSAPCAQHSVGFLSFPGKSTALKKKKHSTLEILVSELSFRISHLSMHNLELAVELCDLCPTSRLVVMPNQKKR